MENQPENKSEPIKIEKHLLDRKKFKRQYRRMFDSYADQLYLVKWPNDRAMYALTWRKIMKKVSDALLKDITYDIGNIYFIMGILNDHMQFLSDCVKRSKETHEQMMPTLFAVIHEKNSKLLDIFVSNETHPVSITELEKKYAGDIINDGQ